jgi:flagellar motor protein MotB
MTRRILLSHGVRPDQIAEIRGYADRRILFRSDPSDSRNRRVSVVMKYGGDN